MMTTSHALVISFLGIIFFGALFGYVGWDADDNAARQRNNWLWSCAKHRPLTDCESDYGRLRP